jgi:hypothetical protein
VYKLAFRGDGAKIQQKGKEFHGFHFLKLSTINKKMWSNVELSGYFFLNLAL